MDKKLSFIKERILYLTELKGFGKEEFFSKIGMTYGNFKGRFKEKPINSNALENILSIIPDVNTHWLLTGEGEPIINKAYQNDDKLRDVNEAEPIYLKSSEEAIAEKVLEKLSPLMKKIDRIEQHQKELFNQLNNKKDAN